MVLSLSHCYRNDRFVALPVIFPLWVAFTTVSYCDYFLTCFFLFLSLWEVLFFIFQLLGFNTVLYIHSQSTYWHLGTIKWGRLLVQKWIELVPALSGLTRVDPGWLCHCRCCRVVPRPWARRCRSSCVLGTLAPVLLSWERTSLRVIGDHGSGQEACPAV